MNSSRDWNEKLYENALLIELAARWSHCGAANAAILSLSDPLPWQAGPRPIVDGTIIVDPKVVSAFKRHAHRRMLGYPHITGLEVGVPSTSRNQPWLGSRVIRGGQEENRGLHG